MYAFLWIMSWIFGSSAYFSYFRAIFRGTTKPHLYTWGLWGTLASIAAIVSIRNNAGWWVIVPCLMAVCNVSIAILSIKYGEALITKKDIFLLSCALLTLILWGFTQNDLMAIVLVCVIDMIGFYFTWKKSYYSPYEEDLTSYIIWTVELGCAFFAIEHLSLTNWLYPGLLASVELLFVIFLIWRRKTIK